MPSSLRNRLCALALAAAGLCWVVFGQGGIKVGYAVVSGAVAGQTAPFGTALFRFVDSDGVLVSEAGVGAVRPIASGRVFVDQVGTRTALALVNTASEAATLDLTLKDASGQTIRETVQPFASHEHLALFVDELFDGLPADFVGSLSFGSVDGLERWAAVTLRQTLSAEQQYIVATLPVIPDTDASRTDSILFPQVGAGLGFSTQILLINPSADAATGRIRLTDSGGAPLELDFQGARASEFEYSIPPFGVQRQQFSRSDGQTAVGYAVVTPDQGVTPSGTALFQFTSGEGVISEAGVAAAPLLTRARIFVDNAGTRTGVALASPGNPTRDFTFRLLDREQREIENDTREVAADGHLAIFADEIFPELPSGFTGILEISTDVAFAPVTLKLTINLRNNPILTTLPVVDLDHPQVEAPVYFPQVGFGLGFSTRLILLNGELVNPNEGTLSFFDSTGQGLVVPIGGEQASSTTFTLGAGAARQFFPGVTAGAAEILVQNIDLTINQGSTRPLRPIVLDELGNARDDLPLGYQSLNPETVQVDPAGNMTALNRGFSTIVITSGEILRRFTVTSGTITSGVAGIAPSDVAQDFAGNIFLANSLDHTVLETVSVEQAPSLYAGVPNQPGIQNGLRLQARFHGPASLAINQGTGGELYVSDTLNHVIRVVRPGASGEVSTLAGTGQPGSQDGPALQAGFRSPGGVALEERGFLWVADTGNQTIRRINLATGQVSTVAGRPGSSGNVDGMGDQARFNEPRGLVFEAETLSRQLVREQTGAPPPPASVLVADSGNNAIRRVWEDGRVETLSPLNVEAARQRRPGVRFQTTPAFRFDSPAGLVLDPFGNLFVSEASTGLVKAVLRTGEVALAAEPGTFSNPGGLTTTIRGRILVAEANRTVQQIRYAGPTITAVEPASFPSSAGQSVTVQGRNFAPESIVIVGGVPIGTVTFHDTTRLTFTSPDLPSGRQALTVQHRGGQAQTAVDIVPPSPAELAPGGITTLAGGTSDVGDGLEATAATLDGPAGVALSPSGDLYLSDGLQHRLRRVSAITGIIQTVAGTGQPGTSSDSGPALLFDLQSPGSVVVTPAGSVCFADRVRHQILAYRPETGRVEVLAGTGEEGFSGDGEDARLARLSAPSGLAVGADGLLWISDTGNQRIRTLDLSSGIIRTVVGSGHQGFAGDFGDALLADLDTPMGLAFRPDGSLLIADSGNNRIRILRPDSTIESIAGDGSADFRGDGSSARFAALNDPVDVAVDADGTIYIADSGNQRIRRIIGGIITTLAGTGLPAFGGDGGPAGAASFDHPSALAVDGGGHLLVVDTGNRRIRRILLADGTVTTVAGSDADLSGDGGPGWRAALADPTGLALDRDRLLIVERGAHRIRQLAHGAKPIEGDPGIITTLAGTGRPGDSDGNSDPLEAELREPTGLSVDSEGVIVFSDTGNHRLRRLAGSLLSTLAGTGEPGFLDDVPGSLAPLNGPTGVAFRPDGGVVWADTLNQRIRVLGTEGYVSVLAGTGEAGFAGDGGRPALARLRTPQGVFVTGDGRTFISDTDNHRVRLVTRQPDQITTVAGNGLQGFAGDGGPATEASLDSPTGLFVDESDRLFIADTGNHRIRVVDLSTGTIATVAGSDGSGFSGDGGPATAARLHSPWGVVADGQGNLYVSDSGNQRVRFIRGPGQPAQ